MHNAMKRGAARRSVITEHRSSHGGLCRLASARIDRTELRELQRAGLLLPKVAADLHRDACQARTAVRREIGRQMEPTPTRSQRSIRAMRVAARVNRPDLSGKLRRHAVRWLGDSLDRKANRRAGRHPKDLYSRIAERLGAFDPCNPRSDVYLWEPLR